MSHLALLGVSAANLVIVAIAIGVGDAVLAPLEHRLTAAGDTGAGDDAAPSIERMGASLLVGMGTISYVGVLLGLAHAFSAWTLVPSLAIVAIAVRRPLLRYFAWMRARLGQRAWPQDPVAAPIGFVVVLLCASNYLAALAPPVSRDALSYHLPQAHELASGHVLWLSLGGHPFYGNLPKLMEVLYAEGISLAGDGLAQALHFTVLVGFALFLFGVVRRLFGPRAALLAVLAIQLYPELTLNATAATIDAGVVSFEAGAMIAAASWVQCGRSCDAVRAALLIGFALAAKYSAAATLLMLALLCVVVARRRHWSRERAMRAVVGLGALIAGAAGLWYAKNAVRYGNPTYPLYFGHPGMSDQSYQAQLADIQEFGPRTLSAFIHIPDHFRQVSALAPFLSFFVAPLALLAGTGRRFVLTLIVYAAAYVPYWFFVASHQTRFLMPALVVTLVLSAIVLGTARTRTRLASVGVAAAVGCLVFWPGLLSAIRWQGGSAVGLVTQARTARYALGLETKDAFLTRNYGCQYAVVAFLRRHGQPGNVLDTWSQWHDANVAYYSGRHEFASLSTRGSARADWHALRASDIAYYYVRKGTKQRWVGTRDSLERRYLQARGPVDQLVANHAVPIFRSADCVVARITPGHRTPPVD